MGTIEKVLSDDGRTGRLRTAGHEKEPVAVSISEPRCHHIRLDDKHLARNRVLTSGSPGSARAAYKMLRTRVLQRMRSRDWRVLALTSAGQGEGKTLTAINLAISIAKQPGQSVILLDLDLRNPSITRYLGMEVGLGLVGWFEKKADLSDILVSTGLDRLYVVPNDTSFDDSSERLQSQHMIELIEKLKEQFPSSLLIADLPPLLEADDTLAFSPYVDAFLLVVSQGHTLRDRLPRARELLHSSEMLGVVLNKSDEAASGYY